MKLYGNPIAQQWRVSLKLPSLCGPLHLGVKLGNLYSNNLAIPTQGENKADLCVSTNFLPSNTCRSAHVNWSTPILENSNELVAASILNIRWVDSEVQIISLNAELLSGLLLDVHPTNYKLLNLKTPAIVSCIESSLSSFA